MSLAESIAPHVPHLRRFARLLTGSQAGGDAAVERVLKAVAADPSIFPDLCHRASASTGASWRRYARSHREPAPSAPELLGGTAARSLAALTPEGRQAFFLVSVEGFSRA